MLQAIVQNNTELDIKDIVIAYVAWDANNLPIKLKGSMDFSNGAYIKHVNFEGVNLIPSATYGKNNGTIPIMQVFRKHLQKRNILMT